MITENRRSRAHVDWPLIILVFGMCIFGVFAVTVASYSTKASADASLLQHILDSTYAVRQVLFVVVAGVITAVMLAVPYEWIRRLTPVLYWASVILLTVTFVFNRAAGVKAWLDIFFGMTIQPSEFIKLTIILMLARVLATDEHPLSNVQSWLRIGVTVGVPAAVTLVSGEMGSILVIVFMVAVMLWFANVDLRMVFIIGGVGILGILALYGFMLAFNSDSYRLARILAFFNPEMYSSTDAYQMQQSMMTIGAGGMWGIGTFVDGAMSQLNYVPADWTDFIFATIGEAFGFRGCAIIALVYLMIILRMLYLARHTRDRYGMLIICGVMGMLLFHVFENMGMTLGLMPITGIPLPFLSYGGSNMVTNIAAVGLVLNVTKNRSLSSSVSTPQVRMNKYTAVHDYH